MTSRIRSTLYRSTRSGLLFGLCLFCSAAWAGGIINPPVPHWIGPEADCDYPTIQAALDDIFDCGLIHPCPQGRNELRLSADYNHTGQIVVDRTFDIRGGYDTCEGAFNSSAQSTLAVGFGGEPLFVIRPGTGSINNVLRNLRLFGNPLPGPRGGVIDMEAGDASLTLRNSRVSAGRAILSGGGVAMAGYGNRLTIDNSRIHDNEALQGGGIFCTNGGVIDFQSGIIEENIAEVSGGGIYMQAGCRLIGNTRNRNRQIRLNRVTDIQNGEGAGVYALASTIDLGALFSRTIFQENEVEWGLPLHDYDQPGNNRGGGVHLDSSNATFINTWFRANVAADGGAISAVGTSNVLVDRSSGPCHSTDAGNSADCSLFEYNRARGGKDSDGDEGGDGAVIFVDESFGNSPNVRISRSTWRFNAASCHENEAPLFTGECDLETDDGYSRTSIAQGPRFDSGSSLSLRGNLTYGNDIGDDEDCDFPSSCIKTGVHFSQVSEFSNNTSSDNLDADYFIFSYFSGPSPSARILDNIVVDAESDDFYGGSNMVASCNISNFADTMNLFAASVPINNVDLDPQFIAPGNEDFRISVPGSPAIDRCNDADGIERLSYDIVGTPRPLDFPGTSNGPGQRDVGAFEAKPDGYVNNGIDLELSMASALPKTTELLEPHRFTVTVRNSGRNGTGMLTVDVGPISGNATLTALSSGRNLNGELGWNCNLATATCTALLTLGPGGTMPPITMHVSFQTAGIKTVAAQVRMLDSALLELTPANNTDSDTVTVLASDEIFADGFDG